MYKGYSHFSYWKVYNSDSRRTPHIILHA